MPWAKGPQAEGGYLQVGGSDHYQIEHRLTSLSILARLGASEGRSDAIRLSMHRMTRHHHPAQALGATGGLAALVGWVPTAVSARSAYKVKGEVPEGSAEMKLA